MQVLDRESAIAAWRRAESRIYPSVMLNADLYQQYIGLVRSIAALLEDVRTEDDLVVAWNERRELVQEAVSRSTPSMLTLIEDVTPLGSHRLEMHVASGRALHASSELPLDASRPKFSLEVVQLDPADGAWLLDKPPLMPAQTFDTREEWDARIEQARIRFGRG
jgi:hypothetical protein